MNGAIHGATTLDDSLNCALERLYQSGWSPGLSELPCDVLPDGRKVPVVADVKREFERAGLELSIKHNPLFNTFRAAWEPIVPTCDLRGTVIGTSETEAAVYALAQLREARQSSRLTLA